MFRSTEHVPMSCLMSSLPFTTFLVLRPQPSPLSIRQAQLLTEEKHAHVVWWCEDNKPTNWRVTSHALPEEAKEGWHVDEDHSLSTSLRMEAAVYPIPPNMAFSHLYHWVRSANVWNAGRPNLDLFERVSFFCHRCLFWVQALGFCKVPMRSVTDKSRDRSSQLDYILFRL